MIFGKRSERGLKYARTRAKIDEFMIDPGEMPGFAFDSDSLCFESVLAISDALDLLSEKGELEEICPIRPLSSMPPQMKIGMLKKPTATGLWPARHTSFSETTEVQNLL